MTSPKVFILKQLFVTSALVLCVCGFSLPAQAQITAELGISPATARRACRELACLGLIRLIPGHGYYPGTRP